MTVYDNEVIKVGDIEVTVREFQRTKCKLSVRADRKTPIKRVGYYNTITQQVEYNEYA